MTQQKLQNSSDAGTTPGPIRLPSEADPPPPAKLPMPRLENSELPPALREAWVAYMVNGFKQNEEMFHGTRKAFMKPYWLTIWLYGTLFVVGLILFVLTAVAGLQNDNSVTTVTFGGLGTVAFLTFFIKDPLRALEKNLESITWLGVAFNTYWARLMYMSDPNTIQNELKAAEEDFRASVERLIAHRSEDSKKLGKN